MRIGLLGIQRSASPDDWTLKRHDPLTAFVMAVKECYFVISRSLGYLYDVITGREAADQLGGPIRIAQVSGQVATAGFFALLNLAAIISVSIGLINLFPIPMLDGGHLLFYGIEAVRGKPLSENTQEIGFRIGLAFVLMLMIFATWNDLNSLEVSLSCGVNQSQRTRSFLRPPGGSDQNRPQKLATFDRGLCVHGGSVLRGRHQ